MMDKLVKYKMFDIQPNYTGPKGWNNSSNFAMERNQSEYGRENKCLKEVAIKIIYRFIRNQSLVLLGF